MAGKISDSALKVPKRTPHRSLFKAMRWVLATLITLLSAFILMPSIPVSSSGIDCEPIAVYVDGERVIFPDQEPVIIDGRVLVPVRAVFEAMGFEVEWGDRRNEVTLVENERTVIIPVGNDVFYTYRFSIANIQLYTLSSITQILNQRTVMSIQTVLELFNFIYNWDDTTNIITIQSPVVVNIGSWSNYPSSISMNEQFARFLSSGAVPADVTHLYISGNRLLTDISPLAQFTELRSLNFRHSHVSDISPLSSLSNLRRLDLAFHEISDISPLASLPNLTILDLRENRISDTAQFAAFNNLIALELSGNQINDIEALSMVVYTYLPNLTNLSVSGDWHDITPLASLVNLERLQLVSNITDISPLANLVNLRSLKLLGGVFGNQTIDISPLASLVNLESLSMSNRQVDDITPLANLINLWSLSWQGAFPANGISVLAEHSTLSLFEIDYRDILGVRGWNVNHSDDLIRFSALSNLDYFVMFLHHISVHEEMQIRTALPNTITVISVGAG